VPLYTLVVDLLAITADSRLDPPIPVQTTVFCIDSLDLRFDLFMPVRHGGERQSLWPV